MKLSLLLQQLRAGELAQLSPNDKTDEKIIAYINMALVALYSRFQLSTEEAIITLRPDLAKTVYTMDSTDADVRVNNQPMTDDEFMSIIAAYNEDGSLIDVNDDKNPGSIFTVSYNKLQIPILEDNAYVSIIYRRNPTLVTYVDNGSGFATEQTVPLPMQLMEPLCHYVGYRAHGSVDGKLTTENNSHYTRYDAACKRAEELGTLTADDTITCTVASKGFI